MRTTPPKAVSVHQLAGVGAPWVDPPATIAPAIATPSAWPNCLEVVAIAAATPACARGIPDTAALVIGAFTKPRPRPKMAYAASSRPKGVVGPSPVSMAQARIEAAPAIRSGTRGP